MLESANGSSDGGAGTTVGALPLSALNDADEQQPEGNDQNLHQGGNEGMIATDSESAACSNAHHDGPT